MEKNIYKLKEKRVIICKRRKLGFIFQFLINTSFNSTRENIEMPVLLDNEKNR